MKIVIVDVDGTLTNSDHRQHYLASSPKDWDAFFDACQGDSPHHDICDLVDVLDEHYVLVFCTGRPERVRNKTEQWIADNLCSAGKLLMRADGDHRHDVFIKPELIAKEGIEPKDIAFVIEDRDSMVAKWREMGLRVLQVAPGAF